MNIKLKTADPAAAPRAISTGPALHQPATPGHITTAKARVDSAAAEAAKLEQTPVVDVPTASIETPEDAHEKIDERRKELAVKAASELSTHQYSGGGVEGEWTSKNLRLPRLQIVQGQGDLSKQYPGGTVLFADEEFLPALSAKQAAIKVPFVPLQLRKTFFERVENGSGVRPRSFNSSEEVRANGLEPDWVGSRRPDVDETARVVLLMKKPQEVNHPAFAAIPGLDGEYAFGVVYVKGSGFKRFGEVLFQAAVSTLRVGGKPYLPKRWWTLHVDTPPWGKYNPFAFIARQTTEDTSETLREYVEPYLTKTVIDTQE